MFLSDISIKRPIFITMIMVAIALFGIISFRSIGVDLFPRVEFPVITVITVLPGADPSTVETTISKPIEDALSTISSIKNLTSTSADSVSQVVIEFELDKKVDIAYQEVQAKIGTVRSELPSDVEDPIIEKFDIDSAPIMAVVVSGKQPIQELSFIADKTIKGRLQQIPGVGQIKLIGTRDRAIWILLNPQKLEGFSLSIDEVINALRSHHIELPGGRIETGPYEFIVRTKAELENVQDFNSLLITYKNDYPVTLQDVAEVVDGLEEERTLARLNDQKAIALLVRRQSGTNTVSVAHAVKNAIQTLQQDLKKENISIELAQDLSVYIERSIHEIQFHLVFGAILAVFIVFVFLKNARITLISAVAIPLSVIGTFIFLYALDFTMNSMTMLALSLAIGILIDDAIVVVENIYRHFKLLGPDKESSAKEASRIGTQEIGLAAFAITMSIVAVFLPVAFMKGIIGRFFYQFGMTVTISVLMSLFVAFTLTPMLASQFLRQSLHHGRIFTFVEKILLFVDHSYEKLLRLALKFKKITIIIAVSILVMSLFLAKFISSEFMPMEDQSEFFIRIKAPLGSSLSATDESILAIKKKLENEPWIRYSFITIGTDNLQKVNEGSIYVKMVDKDSRNISQKDAMQKIRKKIESLPYKTSIEPVPRVSGGGRKACAIQLDIKGPNLDQIESIANNVISLLQKKGGYVDLDTSYEKDKPELDIAIKRDRAAALHVTPSSIARTIRTLVGGSTILKFNDNGERYDINVRLPESFRSKLDNVYQLSIKNGFGELISLENVVEITKNKGPVQIVRHNRERTISIYANVQEGKKTLGEAVQEITTIAESLKIPSGYSYRFSGMAEAMKESFSNLIFAFFLAIIMVYMVLASQFESLLQPLIIMLSLPFSIVGALGGLVITQATLNIFTIIGIIMLMGLVTKNAILLVDYTNTLKARNIPTLEALVQAGLTRLRPILMTTFAMIFGMLPIALSNSAGSESRSPMAIAIIGGLVTSMFLTLVVVPVVYALFDSFFRGKKKPSE